MREVGLCWPRVIGPMKNSCLPAVHCFTKWHYFTKKKAISFIFAASLYELEEKSAIPQIIHRKRSLACQKCGITQSSLLLCKHISHILFKLKETQVFLPLTNLRPEREGKCSLMKQLNHRRIPVFHVESIACFIPCGTHRGIAFFIKILTLRDCSCWITIMTRH